MENDLLSELFRQSFEQFKLLHPNASEEELVRKLRIIKSAKAVATLFSTFESYVLLRIAPLVSVMDWLDDTPDKPVITQAVSARLFDLENFAQEEIIRHARRNKRHATESDSAITRLRAKLWDEYFSCISPLKDACEPIRNVCLMIEVAPDELIYSQISNEQFLALLAEKSVLEKIYHNKFLHGWSTFFTAIADVANNFIRKNGGA